MLRAAPLQHQHAPIMATPFALQAAPQAAPQALWLQVV